MRHIKGTPARGSVYYTDAFRGPTSRSSVTASTIRSKATPSHAVDRRTRNHINGIEGFGAMPNISCITYRGVSKYHFPMYLKEIEYRFNHRKDPFRSFVRVYFGYVSA